MTLALAFIGLAVTAYSVARAWLELQRSTAIRFF